MKHLVSNDEYWFNVLFALVPTSLLFSPAASSILLFVLVFWSIINFFFLEKLPLELPLGYKVLFCFYFLFLILHITSLFYTEDISRAFSLLRKRVPLLLIPVIFYMNFKYIDFKTLLKTYVYVVLAAAIFTIFNSFYSIYLNNESLETFFTYYLRYFYISFMPYEMHPSYFGILLCSSLAVLLNNTVKSITLSVLFCVILVFNIYLISSQMITFICIMLFLFFILKKAKEFFNKVLYKSFLILLLILSLILVFNGKFVTKAIVNIFEIHNNSNIFYRASHFFEQGDITRRKNWESAYNVINDNLIFGVGIGDGINEMQKFREKRTWIYTARLNAHNQFLEELVHFGIIGFVCFISLLFIVFYLSKEDLFHLSIFFILFCIMFTESILNRQVGVIVFSFLMSFLVFNNLNKIND
ncbi:O-antigen ligase family protein [Winogradskyella immobilis]|uniref:O-antigen ligase family protein n=1 Tax=Winogradskyella immobilis TaxID=2816852 RepID=A0ABS8EKW7_9FLAO|nr:O-antigen ligase family protein [Winogradskyella immobilis]MCC1483487.1 O-antigen ligase family protein [Winogradskyella immobilis]MCG0015581.1 O-antigen ligase family protein [Winogradskyella immobilis]